MKGERYKDLNFVDWQAYELSYMTSNNHWMAEHMLEACNINQNVRKIQHVSVHMC